MKIFSRNSNQSSSRSGGVRGGFKLFVALLIALVFIGTFVFLWKKSQPKPVVYDELTPAMQDIRKTTIITGKIEPRNEVNVKPQISGIISELLKEPGQYVQQGEVIAKVKVIPDMGSLSSAESRVRLADINLKQTETDFARTQSLHNQQLVSDEEFEKARQQLRQAQEEKAAAVDALQVVREGVSRSNASASSTLIRSTISGIILDIPVKVGNSVINSNTFNDGTTIATIANMKDMIFKGKLDETEVGKIHEGMPLVLTIGAMNDRKFDAVLEYIAPKGTQESGAVFFEMKAKAILPDDVFVRAGYSANAEIILDQAVGAVVVPETCISYEAGETYVYRCTKESMPQEFERQAVKVGLSDGVNIVVTEGLNAGDKIRGNEIVK